MKPLDSMQAPRPARASDPIISVSGLHKTYASGFQALRQVDLNIRRGEIFALLGPNGAGKTTLISIICGIVNPSGGTILADGHDIARDYRAARTKIGLVPQELTTDAFESVWATVKFSRGLFGKPPNPAYLEKILKDLSLWDKKDSKIMTLSGGMKRRVMIAKALSHEPSILFLDEPSAGVDVELRRDMWNMVRGLRESGVTIILTTHYIEEAEEMADRIGVISKGEIVLVEDKNLLMQKLGKKQLTFSCKAPWPPCRRTCNPLIFSFRPRGRNSSTPSTRRATRPALQASCAGSTSTASTSRTFRPPRAPWRKSSSAW